MKDYNEAIDEVIRITKDNSDAMDSYGDSLIFVNSVVDIMNIIYGKGFLEIKNDIKEGLK